MNNKKVKIIGTIIGVLLFVLLIGGISYAWFSWRSNDIVVAGNTACFDINSTKGIDINNDEMLLLDQNEIIDTPNITVTDGMSLTSFTAGIDDTCNIEGYISISINVKTLQDSYRLNGTSHHALKYALVKYEEDYPEISVQALNGESLRMIANGSITSLGNKTIFHDKLPDDGSSNKYIIIFYIDGDKTDEVLNEFTANIKVEASQLPEANSIDDFVYVLGSDQTEISTIDIYNEDAGKVVTYTIDTVNDL